VWSKEDFSVKNRSFLTGADEFFELVHFFQSIS